VSAQAGSSEKAPEAERQATCWPVQCCRRVVWKESEECTVLCRGTRQKTGKHSTIVCAILRAPETGSTAPKCALFGVLLEPKSEHQICGQS